ncbi:MAG: MFS transporter, partial [Clostridia bacterium]|nr:MFS transporter [Clostridia bacterium]
MTSEELQNTSGKKAFSVGFICIFIYLVRYIVPNILSVFSPILQDNGVFDIGFIGSLSSVYCVTYSLGQLVNGILGDRVPPKYMAFIGLSQTLQIVLYGITGFALSMLRGPMVKTISENMSKPHARLACAFLSFAAFTGPLVASLLSLICGWDVAFFATGIFAFAMAVFAFLLLSLFEKIGFCRTPSAKEAGKKQTLREWGADALRVFSLKNFILYMFLGMIFEIWASSIGFWRPTYLSEYLAFSPTTAGLLQTLFSLINATLPFIALGFCRLFRNNDIKAIRFALLPSALLFVAMALCPPTQPILNVILFILAVVACGIGSSIMWSFYIPGLAKSGKVSSANGILDCSGYLGA